MKRKRRSAPARRGLGEGLSGREHTARQFRWIKMVTARTDISAVTKVVAIVLANHWNAKRGFAWPGQEQIAMRAGLWRSKSSTGRKSVHNALTALQAKGFVTKATRSGWGCEYVFLFPKPDAGSAVSKQPEEDVRPCWDTRQPIPLEAPPSGWLDVRRIPAPQRPTYRDPRAMADAVRRYAETAGRSDLADHPLQVS